MNWVVLNVVAPGVGIPRGPGLCGTASRNPLIPNVPQAVVELLPLRSNEKIPAARAETFSRLSVVPARRSLPTPPKWLRRLDSVGGEEIKTRMDS